MVVNVPYNGSLHQFSAVLQTELVANVLAVGLNRVHTEVEPTRDLVRSIALPNELEDFEFPIAEVADFHGPAGIRANGTHVQALPERFAEVVETGGDGPNGLNEVRRSLLFAEVPPSADEQCGFTAYTLGVSAEDQHLRSRAPRQRPPDQINTVAFFEPDIDQDDIRLNGLHEFQRTRGAVDFAAYRYARFATDPRNYPVSHQRMIFDDHYPDGSRGVLVAS